MQTTTQSLLSTWLEARTRFTNQLVALTENDLTKKLGSSPNSVGFLMRHIGDVELLFAKNVFGAADLKVSAQTVIDKHDTGEWTDLEALKAYVDFSAKALQTIIEQQKDTDWYVTITTKEFGEKTKAAALGRIVSHTAYHAGQMALAIKYGA